MKPHWLQSLGLHYLLALLVSHYIHPSGNSWSLLSPEIQLSKGQTVQDRAGMDSWAHRQRLWLQASGEAGQGLLRLISAVKALKGKL